MHGIAHRLSGEEMKKDLDSIILTRQELLIMKAIWDRGTASVKDVCDSLSRRKATAYTTVLTLMGILEGKGALAHTRSGRAYIYHPLLTREQATRNHVQDILNRFFDGDPTKLIRNVLENEVRSPEQQGVVKNLLELRGVNPVV
jgi:BlaI family transcriptional regulator, penicillinase repressor